LLPIAKISRYILSFMWGRLVCHGVLYAVWPPKWPIFSNRNKTHISRNAFTIELGYLNSTSHTLLCGHRVVQMAYFISALKTCFQNTLDMP